MSHRHWLACGAWMLLVVLPSQAAPLATWPAGRTPAELPDTAQVLAALDQDPGVVRAGFARAAADHGAAMLAASPHEWNTRLTGQHRRVDGSPQGGSEWSAQLERAVRIPGKAALDTELGETGQALARAQWGEARHESARDLATLWLDWLAAGRSMDLAQEQLAVARSQVQAVDSRRRAGDASRMEHELALADLTETQRLVAQTEGLLQKARIRLSSRFPTLTLVSRPLSTPTLENLEESAWLERVQAESDSLRLAELSLHQAELVARRLEADRIADPTLGLFTASEAGGRERVVGLTLSVPLGGSYRHQAVQQALRQADMVRTDLDRQRRELILEVRLALAEVRQGQERWQLAERSATAARDNAQRGQRAYALGEGELQNVLQLRRLSLEAAQNALAAQVEALRAHHRLLIDAHLIWDLAEEH